MASHGARESPDMNAARRLPKWEQADNFTPSPCLESLPISFAVHSIITEERQNNNYQAGKHMIEIIASSQLVISPKAGLDVFWCTFPLLIVNSDVLEKGMCSKTKATMH